ETVGNTRRVLVSELSGQSNVHYKVDELGLGIPVESEEARRIVKQMKELEAEGFQFESAEASFELLVKKMTGKHRSFFDLRGFRVITSRQNAEAPTTAEAIIRLSVDGEECH